MRLPFRWEFLADPPPRSCQSTSYQHSVWVPQLWQQSALLRLSISTNLIQKNESVFVQLLCFSCSDRWLLIFYSHKSRLRRGTPQGQRHPGCLGEQWVSHLGRWLSGDKRRTGGQPGRGYASEKSLNFLCFFCSQLALLSDVPTDCHLPPSLQPHRPPQSSHLFLRKPFPSSCHLKFSQPRASRRLG